MDWIDRGANFWHLPGMKCYCCGGRLEGLNKSCPYCGVRQDIDLREIRSRDVRFREPMLCPTCGTSLDAIEVTGGGQTARIERCNSCHGLFFNPEELRILLDRQIHESTRLDIDPPDQIPGPQDASVVYRKCPVCSGAMIRHNFGGKSGVILDRCAIHGFWLDGGEFRRLEEWWRAGGRLIHQQHEAARVRPLHKKNSFLADDTASAESGGMVDTLATVIWAVVVIIIELL